MLKKMLLTSRKKERNKRTFYLLLFSKGSN
jgi:hypothetical protein